jgi:uncharacterized protein (DUF3084 family)
MGKKRHTLFGLRPKHTAIVATTITGMIIAVLTISFMAISSSAVRTLMLNGEKILRERQALIDNYKSARRASEIIAGELTDQRAVAEKARKQTREAIGQRDKLSHDISGLSGRLSELDSSLARNKAELSNAEKHLNLSSQEITRRRQQIKHLESERTKLAAVFVEEMGEAASKFPLYIKLRQEKIILRSNEEIIRGVIPSNLPRAEIRNRVVALLNEADHRARSDGAKVGDNSMAVEIFPKKIETEGSKTGRFLTESENIDAIADQIASGSGQVVARIVCIGNTVDGEQALVDFLLNYNRLAYPAGDEVASGIIDGRQSRGGILEDLITFLRKDARNAAERRGVIPSLDDTGQPSVGQLDWDDLFNLVDKIKAAGKPVKVTARAAKETWSAGPLILSMEVGNSR